MGMSAFRKMRVERARREAYEKALAQQNIEKELPAQEAPVDTTDEAIQAESATPVEEATEDIQAEIFIDDTDEVTQAVSPVDVAEAVAKTTRKKSDAEKMKKKN